MIVAIDPRSAVPPYEQLRAQLVSLIRSGALAAGSRLPPIRQLAKDLGVATGTIARAYGELDREGLVVARGRHGTVVADGAAAAPTAERERQRLLAAAARVYATEARRLGVGADAAVGAVESALGGA